MPTMQSREDLIANPPFALTEVDKDTLRQTDEGFELHSWENLKETIATNALDTLRRTPSDLVNYIHFTRLVKSTYGNITTYLLNRLLSWVPPDSTTEDIVRRLPLPCANPIPFSSPNDYLIRRNDWPYATAAGISHLVIWLKTPIEVDREGDPSVKSRELIESFIQKTFKDRLGAGTGDDRVIWFRNRTQWQSVRSVEHIHVLLRDADDALIECLTAQKEADIEARKWENGERVIGV